MMSKVLRAVCLATAVLTVPALPALAQGDAALGATAFGKCKSCHSVTRDDGTELVKGGKVGPNLWAVVGRAAAATDFAYSEGMKAAGAAGLIWDEAAIASYVTDPTAFLRDKSGDAAAKSKMTFKLAKGGEDIAAYLASLTQ